VTREAAAGISDLQFTAAYRVPFQYSRIVRQNLPTGSFLRSSSGVTVTDLDGNVFYDLTGSYGVNLFGHDFYKDCIARGAERVRDLGPVLGAYHPAVAYNVARLREISGLDEVSFHMSGTEAVMQAVRLARYHTNRSPGAILRRLSRLVGRRSAGHRQPVAGATTPTLSRTCPNARCAFSAGGATSPASWSIRCRRCIRTPAAPADSSLVDSARQAGFDRPPIPTG
jgi:glutamate-1-semialdehyde 2,1-aminomutase